MVRGGTTRFRPWHAQRNTYVQLHVERASAWHLSRWRFAGVCVKRTADQLRTDRRRSPRFRNFDEDVVSRERPQRDLSRNRCNRRRWIAERIAVRTFWAGLSRTRWSLFAFRPHGSRMQG